MRNPSTRLLLVEDNPGDALLIEEMLFEAPTSSFELTHVSRCDEALHQLIAGDIDVVLLDLSLPDAFGLEAVSRIHAAAPTVPIVILSGNANEEMALAGVRQGAQDYLVKGRADADLLVRAVRYAIERQRAEAQLAQARATELALREANRRMDEFLGIAGHEMRTPCTSIQGNIQLAQQRLARLAGGDEARTSRLAAPISGAVQLLARTDRQIARLNRLIDELLDVSRIQSGHLEMRFERCNLAAVLRDTVQEQRQLAAPRVIDLELDEEAEAWVIADADRLGQVIANYLSNALRYSPADQPIAAGLHLDGASAHVWVRDIGPGLATEEHERIWDRFYRVGSVEPQYGSSVGLGLGLHISKAIITHHRGAVGVTSTPGAGATFWFSVPLAS